MPVREDAPLAKNSSFENFPAGDNAASRDFSGIFLDSCNIANQSFFQNSIFIQPYVFRLCKAWIKVFSAPE